MFLRLIPQPLIGRIFKHFFQIDSQWDRNKQHKRQGNYLGEKNKKKHYICSDPTPWESDLFLFLSLLAEQRA